MPVKPAPTKYTCQQCDWHGIAMPKGDAFIIDGGTAKKLKIPADYYSSCPQCQSEELTVILATSSEILIASLKNIIG